MADTDAPAPAEEPAATPETMAEPPPDPGPERVAALIRNGLANSAISQSDAAWRALETRLGEIARAILKEI